jgi:hypothetical protein
MRSQDRLGNQIVFARLVAEHRSFHNVESCLDSRPPTWPSPRNEEFLNRYFAPQQYQPLNAFQSQAVSFRSELHIGRWLKAGRFFEDIQERSRAVDSVALRIAYSFHDTRTFQSFDGCTA